MTFATDNRQKSLQIALLLALTARILLRSPPLWAPLTRRWPLLVRSRCSRRLRHRFDPPTDGSAAAAPARGPAASLRVGRAPSALCRGSRPRPRAGRSGALERALGPARARRARCAAARRRSSAAHSTRRRSGSRSCSATSTSRASPTRSPSSSARPPSTRRWRDRGSPAHGAERASRRRRPSSRRRQLERCAQIWPLAGRAWTAAHAARVAVPSGSPRPSHGRRADVATLRRQQALTAQRLTAARDARPRRRAALGRPHRGRRRRAPTRRRAPRRATGRTPAAPAPGGRARSSSTPSPTTSRAAPRAACPSGSGVIAVDPGVIPLGTRVFVPGYGPAVAADVGSAIRGNIIDLWMPSTAQALRLGPALPSRSPFTVDHVRARGLLAVVSVVCAPRPQRRRRPGPPGSSRGSRTR